MTRTAAERKNDEIFAALLRETISSRQFSSEELAFTLRWKASKLNDLLSGSRRAVLDDIAKIVAVIAEYDRENYLSVAQNLQAKTRVELYGCDPSFFDVTPRKNFDLIQIYPFHCDPKKEKDPRQIFAGCTTRFLHSLPKGGKREAIAVALGWSPDILSNLVNGKRKLDCWELCAIANAADKMAAGKRHKKSRPVFQAVVDDYFNSIWRNYLNQWLDLPPNILRESLLFPVGRLRQSR